MDSVDSRAVIPEVSHEDIYEKMKCLAFNVQKDFCEHIQTLEGCHNFNTRTWETEGGLGITHFLEGGDLFEKVGVCASFVEGVLPLSVAVLLKGSYDDQPDLPQNQKFYTAGVNGVVYPKNPHVPALNFSYRYFEMRNDGCNKIWWFGGGTDLTPYILHTDDFKQYHEVLKKCCDLYNKSYYRTFKKGCDEHFYLEHRGEVRGIGGIFFDELNYPDRKTCFDFVKACTDNIVDSYIPIVLKNKHLVFSQHDKNWQLLQRGRSVEYSLICDKATHYVLTTPGVQYENMFISLPPEVKWQYNYAPEENTKQSELLDILRNPRDWV